MKKIVLLGLLIIVFFSGNALAMDIFEQESWIAAYFFDDLNSVERYYPFLDIRLNNCYIDRPGNAVRTVISDYILSRDFEIIKIITEDEGFKNVETREDLLEFLNSLDFSGFKRSMLEKFILELKALNLLRQEVNDRKTFLENYLGFQMYSIFLYRFYHLQVTQYERFSLTPEPDLNVHFNYEIDYFDRLKFGFEEKTSEDIIGNAVLDYMGVYNEKIGVNNGEIRESMIATERINSMLPIFPESIINQVNSPLISFQKQPLSMEVKRDYVKRFDNPRFVWSYKVGVMEFGFDRNILEGINNYFDLFNEDITGYMKGFYFSVFGNKFLEDEKYDHDTIGQLLFDIKN